MLLLLFLLRFNRSLACFSCKRLLVRLDLISSNFRSRSLVLVLVDEVEVFNLLDASRDGLRLEVDDDDVVVVVVDVVALCV